MRLIALIVAAASVAACGTASSEASPMPSPPAPTFRHLSLGHPQITLADPTGPARAWQIASVATRPGGVVVIGIDGIALGTTTRRAIPGTLALARESLTWGRSVLYLTTNADPAEVRRDLTRAGYPAAPIWTPRTARWCGPDHTAEQFRAACIAYEARRRDVILWLTRGRQLPNDADRTYAFAS